MDKFNKTAVQAEHDMRLKREREENKLCKSEIFSSLNHLVISMDKLVEQCPYELVEVNKGHIDNVYYHIGKIKGCV